MEDLIQQEKFEIEVLNKLNSRKFLEPLVFAGGSMLRLCYGLDRFSVDIDFWLAKKIDDEKYFKEISNYLEQEYKIKDAANKFYTIVLAFRSQKYSRNLKIEIRKEVKNIKIEKAIAFSKYKNIQILLNTVSLDDMMQAKVDAFLERCEIRDCFDIEFLIKKGIKININEKIRTDLLKNISALNNFDYKVKLGSIIDKEYRAYYLKNNFKILKMELNAL